MNRREAIAALTSLPGLTRVSKADLKPNDVIVVEVDQYLSQEYAQRLKTQLQEFWPEHKVVVLSGNITLKVVSG